MQTAQIELPPKLVDVFTPRRGALRYRGAHGGRGSAKSFSFAMMAAVWGYVDPLRILCTRDLQTSIKESFHAELKNAIASVPWLESHYDVGVDYLRGKNGTEFLFKGLRHNISGIKSMAQIDLCIVEEAEDVTEQSWIDLEPTIRAPDSEIWVMWNPRLDGSPVDNRFRKNTPPRSAIVEMNYSDNPWFPDVLEEQRITAQSRMDQGMYDHVWNGAYLKNTEANVFNGKWVIDEFTPQSNWDGAYYGADFGFAADPSTLVKMWVHDSVLYVEDEAYGGGVELDEMPQFYASIPGSKEHVIRADCARPETISHIKRHGYKIEAAPKWAGSIEDGIEHMRSYSKIVIHPRCKNTINEFRLYSYKTDRLTGDILPIIVDDHNHIIDAIRYALSPLVKRKSRGFFDLG